MSRAVSIKTIIEACEAAIAEAEHTYSNWSGGITMRAAPESLVQIKLAEKISEKGVRVVLEYGVRQFMEESNGKSPALEKIPRNSQGRFDIVAFFKKGEPRLIIEVKKLNGSMSLDRDHKRIQEILQACPGVQCGIIVAYGTAAEKQTLTNRLKSQKSLDGIKLLQPVGPIPVTGKTGRPRFLAAGIYHVQRTNT